MIMFIPAWRSAQAGARVPVSLERQPTTKGSVDFQGSVDIQISRAT